LRELDYIAKTIRSSWEFIDYTFEIVDVTRAFTHQFVRTRTGSYAQQSQRSTNMEGFGVYVPKTVRDNRAAMFHWGEAIAAIERNYLTLIRLGIPTEDARGLLPTNILTSIIAKFNLRTVADICAKRDNLRAQGEYTEVVRAMRECVYEVHPWAKSFIEPERTQTPAINTLLKDWLGNATPVSKPMINDALKELDALKGVWG